MTLKEKAVILLVAFAIRCLFPSSKYKVRRCMHDEEKTEGSSYDNALQEIINLLKSEKSSG